MKHCLFALAVATSFCTSSALASSHREAPNITELPKVDSTDFYMFRSYESGRGDFVTLIANYLPFQDPWGGPNYYFLDPDARYEIHIDNDGDAREDLTFRFRFTNTLRDLTVPVNGQPVSVPLMNLNAVSDVNDTDVNVRETYTVDVIRRGNSGAVRSRGSLTNAANGSDVFDKPKDNIGTKSIADYAAYANQHIYNVNIPDCNAGKLFVGQRREPFYVNVGEIFDLINLNPVGSVSSEPHVLRDQNITTIALEVPIACLVESADQPIIGGWQTASLPRVRTLKDRGGRNLNATNEVGDFVQVSRLSMPLVNEAVIGLKDKDRFNASEPGDDAQFLQYVATPTLPEIIEILFPVAPAPNNFPRNDLIATFLTGIDGVNKPAQVAAAEMMRLNTSVAATSAAAQNKLGALGGDNAGFPNGRRPGDDVVDIELRVVMGALCHAFPGVFCNPADAPAGNVPFTDGTDVSAANFDATFPYLRTPLPGSPNEQNGVLGIAP
jgi:hypothetical protein